MTTNITHANRCIKQICVIFLFKITHPNVEIMEFSRSLIKILR